MDAAHPPLLPALAERVAAIAPSRVLLVGADSAELAAALPLPPTAQAEPLADPPPGPLPYDLALVVGAPTLAALPPATVLARLRDLYARHTLLLAEDGGAPAHGDLMALGFVALGRYRHQDHGLRLYEVALATYKTTPDWLNSRDWANPRLWDKYRW